MQELKGDEALKEKGRETDENSVEIGEEMAPQGQCTNVGGRVGRYILGIKPLAWIIILGDGLHNFADGLAVGAAITASLSLAISTTIALILHEIPHELGDFSILISTGMAWYTALTFNFISALTALLGFFVGVAIGTNSSGAETWILGVTAGVFLYLSLVDLVRLRSSHDRCKMCTEEGVCQNGTFHPCDVV